MTVVFMGILTFAIGWCMPLLRGIYSELCKIRSQLEQKEWR